MYAASGIVMPLQKFDTFPAMRGDPMVKAMIEQLPYTSYGPKIVNFNQMVQLTSDAMQSVVQGKASARDAARNFDEQMKRVLST